MEVTLLVADTLEVRRWILGFGVEAEVVAPEGLREALRVEAEVLAERLTPRRKALAALKNPGEQPIPSERHVKRA